MTKVNGQQLRLNAAKTFDEWKALGYRIKKGQKAVGRNAGGVAVFMPSQVWNTHAPRDYTYWPDFDQEADSELCDWFGISPWGSMD